jgi:hypothetical protein
MAKQELIALKNLIQQADLVLSTTPPLPENRTPVCRGLLASALAITDDLLSQAKLSAAAQMGRKGGAAIAKRGSEYFSQLASKRKAHRGGRPPKESA